MFSRNARLPVRGGKAPPAASIARRLTLLYASTTLVVLVGLELALYGALVSSLRAEDAAVLTDEVALIRAIIADPARGVGELEDEVVWEPRFEQTRPVAVRVLDARGKVVVESAGPLAEAFSRAAFPTATPPARPLAPVRWEATDGRSLLLASAWATPPRAVRGKNHLDVVLDISREERLLATYRAWGAAALITVVLLSGLAGAAVARAGMRPLDDIKAAAERITASSLAERVSETAWPRELTGLAGALDAMLARLEGAFARLSRLSADLAHELRTPLGNLMGEIDLALGRDRAAAEYRGALESAMEEVTRMCRMVDALLFLARTESPASSFDSALFEARTEVEVVCDFFGGTAAAGGVVLVCEGGGCVEGNAGLFRAAVANLVGNALKFTPSGGKVTIAIDQTVDGSLEVRVIDTGPGITPEQLPHIFDRFYRAAPAETEAVPGAGLGLAIVRAIMVRHGGSVEVESRPGEGATFSLHFPPPSGSETPASTACRPT